MALDFPTSPTDGQTYSGFTYNSTIGAWQTNTSTVAPSTVSATVPTNPTNGDMWFNTTDGTLYFYYNDGSSSQWVEARAPITSDGYYSPNYILNSAFDIWQRGTSGTPTSATTRYVADRWETYRASYGTGLTISRQAATDATLLPNIQYCMRVQRTSTTTGTGLISAAQAVESVNSIPLAGKTVTLSFYARAGANYSSASSALSVSVQTGTGTDQPLGAATPIGAFATGALAPISQTATLTTSWQRFSYTAILSTTLTQVGVVFSYTPVGTAGTNDYFEITGIQLEEASVAMPFHRQTPSIQAELAACQRYYVKTFNQSVTPAANTGQAGALLVTNGSGTGTAQGLVVTWQFPVEMRSTPSTVTTYCPSAAAGSNWFLSSGATVTAGTSNPGTRGVTIYNTGTSASGTNAAIHATAEAEL